MMVRNAKDFWAGVLFFAFGLFFACYGLTYALGNLHRIGPGFFPLLLGGALAAVGLAIALGACGRAAALDKVRKFSVAAVASVLGSVVLFALCLHWLGLLLSIVGLVILSMFASHEFRWKEALMLATVMALLVVVIFVYGLKMPIPLWPTFFTAA